MPSLGKPIILAGLALIALGLFFLYGEKLPIQPGKLPGDFVFRGKNSVVYMPLATCVLLSLLASLLLWLADRIK